jgi:hypothetical protein
MAHQVSCQCPFNCNSAERRERNPIGVRFRALDMQAAMRREAADRARPAAARRCDGRLHVGATWGFALLFAAFGRVLCLHPEKPEERARKGTYGYDPKRSSVFAPLLNVCIPA